MAGPSFNQIMMLGGLGIAGLAIYEIWVNQGSIQAFIQNALNPINPYQQQGYYCPGGGVPGPTGLCPNGQPAINQSQFNQIASMAGGCSDGSIVNPATGRCANGSYPMPTGGYGNPYGYGAGGLGYPQTSVCNDGSQPNPVNGLCSNGSIPTTVGTGVNNSMMNPYGAPQYVQPSIMGGVGVPGTTTFTDPTTGQTYDPSTGMLLTPGGSYNTPSLATPYGSIFPTLNPLGGGWRDGGGGGSQIGTCADGSTVNAGTGVCQNGQPPIGTTLAPPNTTSSSPPVSTTIGTPNPVTGTLSCADGSATNANGLCNNGQPPVVSLPAGTTTTPSGTVPVTATPTPTGVAITPTPTPAPTPAPTPVVSTPPTTQVSTTPVTTTTTTPVSTTTGTPGTPGGSTSTTTSTNTTGQHNRFGGSGGNMQSRYRFNSYVGYQSEGAMMAAQAFGYTPRDRSRASVTSYSSVRPKVGSSPITNEVFGRRFYTSSPIYVSGIY